MNVFTLILNIVMIFLLSCSEQGYYQKKGQEILKKYKGNYVLVVSKKNFTLFVVGKDGIIAQYPIGYGLNPDKKPKLYANDNRTPEGLYYITEILSMDAPKNSSAYKTLLEMNKVYFKAKDGHYKFGHPDVDLGDNAYGPRFYRISYPNNHDVARYEEAKKNGTLPKVKGKIPGIGSGIAIHGNNDPDSIGQLASSGCIRMYNDDIIELEQYIQVGTPVVILPD
ncbi:MAG: L,D-transpeptidase [Spirochaetes bacterium]|nr:L,D-transpeptidase [Spirochaetota bacterium]